MSTNRFRDDLPQYHRRGSEELMPATSTPPVILKEPLAIGPRFWKEGYHDKKAGVMRQTSPSATNMVCCSMLVIITVTSD